MASKRKNFTISDRILKKLEKMVPPGHRSKVVEQALENELDKMGKIKYIKKLKKEDPIWTDKNHPDLNTPEDFRNYRYKLWGII